MIINKLYDVIRFWLLIGSFTFDRIMKCTFIGELTFPLTPAMEVKRY